MYVSVLFTQMNRLSSPSILMESQMNGNYGENSSSSSSNSSTIPANSSSDNTSNKPYKPKFHNYKKLDLTKTSTLVMPSSMAPISTANSSTPSTPSTPSFFSANAGNLVSSFIIFNIQEASSYSLFVLFTYCL